jgi:hypothetical protein
LVQLGEQDHVLFWSIHHAIGDGWSSGILMREIAAVYPALAQGQVPSLPPMAIDFADFAHWQRRVLGGDALDNQLGFWKHALAGLEPLPLPFDRPRRGENNGRGARVSAEFPPQTLTALNALAVQHGVTPYMALLACFQLLLARHCDTTDVAVGTPIANRTHMASEHLVGTLVNTVVVRTDLAGDPTFSELLKRVRETALQAYAHQDLPFEALVEALAVPRSDGSAPLVQVLFNVLNAPTGERIPGLVYEPFACWRASSCSWTRCWPTRSSRCRPSCSLVRKTGRRWRDGTTRRWPFPTMPSSTRSCSARRCARPTVWRCAAAPMC